MENERRDTDRPALSSPKRGVIAADELSSQESTPFGEEAATATVKDLDASTLDASSDERVAWSRSPSNRPSHFEPRDATPWDTEIDTVTHTSPTVTPTRSSGRRAEIVCEAIARYEILFEIGAGGMGTVYAAHDPELDRKVAVKLLHSSYLGRSAHRAHKRLAREAKALAKLSHPNVVAVYDTGEHEGGVFIAMELVEGQSLRDWRNQATQSDWRQTLDYFLAAGRGLAAAHAIGLIHRDFKPDNVLLGRDGRVRVADFGLAATLQDGDSGELSTTEPSVDSEQDEMLQGNLTKTGAMLGTLAYMAPEQHVGDKIGPYTDQYNFCVSLYECLYGARPFAAERRRGNLRELLQEKREERIEAPPDDSKVPQWLREVVVRGLAADPSERWPSMDALIAALTDDAEARRRRYLVAGGAALVLVALLGVAVTGWLREPAAADRFCDDAAETLELAWNDDLRARMKASFAATGRPQSAATFAQVAKIFDDYTSTWATAQAEACAATNEHGQQSERVLDLRARCLRRGLGRMRSFATLFAGSADVEVLSESVVAALALPPVAYCNDIDALNAAYPLPEDPATRRQVEALQDRLDQASALYETGKLREAFESAKAIATDVGDLDYPPVQARAKYQLALGHTNAGDPKDAEPVFRDMLDSAATAKDDALIARGWGELMWLLSEKLGRYQDALELRDVAEMAVRRSGDLLVRAEVMSRISGILRTAGRFAESRDMEESILALRTEMLDAGHHEIGDSLHNMALALHGLGKIDAAQSYFDRAQAIYDRALGPVHPRRADALNNMGVLYGESGDVDKARDYYLRTLALSEEIYGSDHPGLNTILQNVGVNYYQNGEYEKSLEYYRRGLELAKAGLGEDHPRTASLYQEIGNTSHAVGKLDESLVAMTAALDIRTRTLGPEHPKVASSLANMGVLLTSLERLDEARDHLERSIAISEKLFGPEHPSLGHPLNELAGLANRQDRHEDALALHLRSMKIREKAFGPDSSQLARSIMYVGATLHKMGRHEEALTRFRHALQLQEKAFGPEHPHVAETLNSLGVTTSLMGEYEESRRYHERSLAIKEKIYGAEHRNIVSGLLNLGAMLADAGLYDDARAAYLRASAMAGRVFPEEDSEIARVYNNFGALLYKVGELATARSYHEKALAIRERRRGPNSTDVANSLGNLANVLRDQGELARARELCERAVAISDKAVGPEHRDVIALLLGLGDIRLEQGEIAGARESYQRALSVANKVHGDEHPIVAEALTGLGEVATAGGESDRAMELYGRALAMAESKLGPDHAGLARALIGQAQVALAGDKPRDALAVAQRAAEICQSNRCLPSAHFVLARALWQANQGRKRALSLARRARKAFAARGSQARRDEVSAWLTSR